MTAAASPWVVRYGAGRSRLRLLCFPFAGGAASTFRTWPDRLPAMVEVCAVQPPGREARLKEAPIRSLPTLVDALIEETRACRQPPFVFFGHSLGAIVAFELARALRRRGETMPVHLFVSGCGAPQQAAPELLSALPEAELIERLRRMGGTPGEVLEHAEMLELLLPTVRADFALRDSYVHASEPPLDIPVSAYGGHDDNEVTQSRLAAWRDQTRARFTLRGFPGGHFFLRTARDLLLEALAGELKQLYSADDDSAVRSVVARGRHARSHG